VDISNYRDVFGSADLFSYTRPHPVGLGACHIYITYLFIVYFCHPGTKEVLPFGEEACCTGASEYSERPVSNYHCGMAQGSRLVEKLDQILVRSEAWTAAAV